MAEVIGVRFKEVGKVYYFDPIGNKLSAGDKVIVETARGLECGEVATPNKTIDEKELNHPLKPLVRIATKDVEKYATVEDVRVPQVNLIDNTLTAREQAEGWHHGSHADR